MTFVEREALAGCADKVYRYMTGGASRAWGMDIDRWDWVPGVGLIAIVEYGTALRREAAVRYAEGWAERNRELMASAKVVNAMAPFAVFPELYRRTGRKEWLEQARRIADWMLAEAPRTREGAFEHTVTEPDSFPEQVWADTVFMAVLFLARYARLTGDRRAADEAARQTLLHLRLLQEQETGVLFHGWDCGAGDHLSAARWARANAWVAAAVPEIFMELKGLTLVPEELADRYAKLAEGLRALQSDDGLWHTVLDRTDFCKEASGSAGIACGFLKGVRAGLLDESFRQPAELALSGLLPLIAANGEVTRVSGGTPIMPTVEAYNGIPMYPTLYGQGLTLMLLTETLSQAAPAGTPEASKGASRHEFHQ